MPQDRPPIPGAPSLEERRVPPEKVPGCGLAAFAMLLLVQFTIGVIGVSIATYGVFTSGEALSPMRLSYGGMVDVRMLRPLRAAGLLGPDELPDAYHAENVDGSSACAISQGRLIRVGPNDEMPVAEIREVRGDALRVEAVGEGRSVVCTFGEDEGGDRFARMLENRAVEPPVKTPGGE